MDTEIRTIGELSKQANLRVETIRYYEKRGLLPTPQRTPGGHRLYRQQHLERLLSIQNCKGLGFSLGEIQQLLGVLETGDYTCGQIQRVGVSQLRKLREKLAAIQKLESDLSDLIDQCDGSSGRRCAIVDSIVPSENSASGDITRVT